MNKKLSKKKAGLIIMAVCYLFVIACYGYIFVKRSPNERLGIFLMGLTVFFCVMAWILAYIDYRIMGLKIDIENTLTDKGQKNET